MLPSPNQIDDLKRHMKLTLKAKAAAQRGHELLAKGKRREAQRCLDECEELMERASLIAQRWT